MIGINEFRLNEATMQEAIAEYFNNRSMSKGEIECTSVAEAASNSINSHTFIVKVKPKEAK